MMELQHQRLMALAGQLQPESLRVEFYSKRRRKAKPEHIRANAT